MSDQEKRTYDEILISFIDELNSKNPELEMDYDKLTDKERFELLELLLDECNKHMKPYMTHVLGYDWYWFHDYWFEAFKKYNILCIIASRGVGKSHFFTQCLSGYLNFISKGYKSIISSYNDDATKDFLKLVRDDIENNELLSSKIPESKSSDWNKSKLEFKNRSNIKGISITAQIRRVHVNWFIADDILNDDVELTAAEVKKKVYATVLPVVERKRGKFAIVGTKFSEDDIFTFLYEQAMKQDSYHYIELRLEIDREKEKLFFILETEAGIIDKREDIDNLFDYGRMKSLDDADPNYFAREYGCQIVSNKEVPFPRNILLDCRDTELSYEDYKSPKKHYAGGLDFSVSTAKDADETVLMQGYLDEDFCIVPSNIFADNTLETPARMEEVKRRMDKFNRSPILAEKNSMGQTNIDNINRENYHLIPFYTSRTSKIDITEFASRLVKDNKLKLPYKEKADKDLTDKLIYQLAGVKEKKTRQGMRSYGGTTRHDDYYIAFILMVKQLSQRGGPTKIRSYKREDLKYL